jgi:phosphonate transport system substrate-binding protein
MRLLKFILYLSPIIVFIIISSAKELNEESLGSRSNPIKIYFTPSVDAKRIANNAKQLVDFLEKETGYYYTTAIPASFIAVVEAFGTNKADIAGINTFSYLMANEKYGAEARLRVVRDGNQINYKGQFLARYDSGIDSISDIDGHSIAFVDPSSTSGFILPKALLDSRRIKPSEQVFAMRHDNVVIMVYQRQVDAGATYWAPRHPETGEILDARMRVKQQFPDIEKKVKIIGFTEEIPNDPLVFRRNMDEGMKQKVIDAFLKFVATKEGREALYEIYDIVNLIPAKDSDYDKLKQMLKKQNISFEKLVKK